MLFAGMVVFDMYVYVTAPQISAYICRFVQKFFQSEVLGIHLIAGFSLSKLAAICFLINGHVNANASPPAFRRISSVPVVIFPH